MVASTTKIQTYGQMMNGELAMFTRVLEITGIDVKPSWKVDETDERSPNIPLIL